MTTAASCHCGSLKVELPYGPSEAIECNCSYCARVGAVWAYYPLGSLRFLATDGVQRYSASEGRNTHHFCGTCGIEVWADTPDWTQMYDEEGNEIASISQVPKRHGVNLRTVDGLDWSTVKIEKVDGRGESW